MLYNQENFGPYEVEILYSSAPYCGAPIIGSNIGSIRSVGYSDDTSATIFGGIHMTGDVATLQRSQEVADFFDCHSQSLVAINTDVEFFKEPFYIVSSCLDSSNLSCINDDVYWTWRPYDTPIDISTYKSAKVGCSAESKQRRSKFFKRPIASTTSKYQ